MCLPGWDSQLARQQVEEGRGLGRIIVRKQCREPNRVPSVLLLVDIETFFLSFLCFFFFLLRPRP